MAAITSAVTGVVVAGVSIGMSVDQANKAAAERRKAQQAAKKAMDEAIKETQIMPKQELALDLAAYEQAREAQNVAAATAIDAARQGEGRGLAAAVGRAQMANIQGQQAIRAQQGREMMELEKIKAEERAAASDARKNLALGEAEGAAAAAADAAARQQAATSQAIQSGAQAVQAGFQAYADIQGPYDKKFGTQLSSQGTQESLIQDAPWFTQQYGDTSSITGFNQGGYSIGMSPSNLSSVSSPQQAQPYIDPNTRQLINPQTGLPITRP